MFIRNGVEKMNNRIKWKIMDLRERLANFAVDRIFRARWIRHEDGDLGFRIMGMKFWYYKWPDPLIFHSGKWRVMEKREFGESIKSTIPF